jgi:ABC-type sugar transport system ATPase subunit
VVAVSAKQRDKPKVKCIRHRLVNNWEETVSDYILEMKGIDKAFVGTLALNKVDFSLKKGEIMALIGENGAGKSTLMNVLMGIHRADSGQILLNGEPIENRSPYDALLKGIGMVPQELNLIPDISVAENILLHKHQKKGIFINWEDTIRLAAKEIKNLNLDIDPRTKVRNLSAAYQQLVSIARTLAVGSNIIILDEPTASLTSKETEHLFEVIRKLKNEGKSIIIITHHLDEVERLADRVSIMRDSKMVKVARVSELSTDEMIFHMANEKVIQTQKTEYHYSNEEILVVQDYSREHEFHNVNFSVKKGEVFGVAGLVGAGRTELFNCIYGLTKRKTGKLFFEGKEVSISSPGNAIKRGIGLVPEERRRLGIFPVMSVYENIMIPSYDTIKKGGLIRFKNARTRSDEHIRKLRIKTPSNLTAVRSLSGGNQQKVILARWMEKKVKLLILDEPTRGIDVRAKTEIYRLIGDMAKNGVTIVVISSEIDELITVSDRIMIMFNGEVKGIVTPSSDVGREEILRIALQ